MLRYVKSQKKVHPKVLSLECAGLATPAPIIRANTVRELNHEKNHDHRKRPA
jgi:G3E family GTPase